MSDCLVHPNKPEKRTGYVRLMRRASHGGKILAHRLAYEEIYGPIPEGLVVRHKCDNPPCVNPEHLELGTQADNVRDMMMRRRQNNTPQHGEDNSGHKLTQVEVDEIRASPHHALEMARKYGVSRRQIDRIRTGTAWKKTS